MVNLYWMKNITSDTLDLRTYLLFHSKVWVVLTEERSVCFDMQQRQNNSTVSKNVRDVFLVTIWMFFTLSSYQPLQICPHVIFFPGSTHRPLALTLVSVPEMQPCFSLPINHLGFLTLHWHRAPNKIWVRLKSPNIRIQYVSHKRLQAANCYSSGEFLLQTCGSDCSDLSSSSEFSFTWPHDSIWHTEGGGNRGGGCCLIPPTMKGGLCGFVYSALILKKERPHS